MAVASHVTPSIIWSVLSLMIMEFGSFPLVSTQEFDVFIVISKLFNGIFCFILLSVFGMLTTYIVRIKSQLVELMDENMNLFD